MATEVRGVNRAVRSAALAVLLAAGSGACAGVRAPAALSAAELAALYAELPSHRAPRTRAHDAAAAWILGELEELGLQATRQPFTLRTRPAVAFANVEGRTAAADDAPLLLIGAHYDSVPGSPGADDNGSGVVAALALARRLSARQLPIQLGFVFFDAEELGMVGSRHYAEALDERDRARLIGMINLETLGYRDERPGSQTLPTGFELLLDPGDRGDFVSVLGNLDSQRLVETLGLGLASQEDAGLRSVVFSGIPGAGWVLPDTRRSDHSSFWDIGVPALMLTDTANFRNPNYHRPSDAVGTIDLEFLRLIVKGVERGVLLLAAGA